MKQKTKLIHCMYLVTMIVLLNISFVSAYVVGGPKWDVSENYFVTYKGDELPNTYQARLGDASQTWNQVSSKNLYLYQNDEVYGLRVYDGSIDGEYGTLGVTTRYWPWAEYITWATMKVDSDENWYTGTRSPAGTEPDLLSVLTHEMGHAIGIKHTDQPCTGNSRPTMCTGVPVGTTYLRTLETDDKSAIQFLYPYPR